MKNVHLLPTDKPSRLFIDTIENKLYYQPILHNKTVNVLTKHIYITSSEEIKEGDWVFFESSNIVRKVVDSNFAIGVNNIRIHANKKVFKIILTDNKDLIADGVQKIPEEFVQYFVKNPSCESVEVGYGFIRLTETNNEGYWISIPDAEFNMQIEELKTSK